MYENAFSVVKTEIIGVYTQPKRAAWTVARGPRGGPRAKPICYVARGPRSRSHQPSGAAPRLDPATPALVASRLLALLGRHALERLLRDEAQTRVFALDGRGVPARSGRTRVRAGKERARREDARQRTERGERRKKKAGGGAHHALSLMYCTGQPSPSPPVFATRPSTMMGSL